MSVERGAESDATVRECIRLHMLQVDLDEIPNFVEAVELEVGIHEVTTSATTASNGTGRSACSTTMAAGANDAGDNVHSAGGGERRGGHEDCVADGRHAVRRRADLEGETTPQARTATSGLLKSRPGPPQPWERFSSFRRRCSLMCPTLQLAPFLPTRTLL
jgi:hypothetical protein